MGCLVRILIIEDNRELGIRIATLLHERFDAECEIIQCNEEKFDSGIEGRIGHGSRLSLLQALLDESFQCQIPSSFNVILKNTDAIRQIFIPQPYRVAPRKFAGVRNIPIPAQCKSSRKKSRY